MRTLIVCLPSTASSFTTSYDYSLTADGRTLADHGSVPPDLLPSAERGSEVVAVVPAGQLSWHSVELPRGIGAGSPRLRAVLENLLEERLLDDPGLLHLALAPGTASSGPVWVAVCERAWLRGHLQALEAAHCPVNRIVPEFEPETGPLQLHVIGEPDLPQLLATGEALNSLMRLPLSATGLALLPTIADDQDVQVLAEPGVAALAEQLLQRKVSLLTRPQRWLDAAGSSWDLAQFDLASSSRSRTLKRLSGIGREWLQSPVWRPARWGVALLLAANLLGINAWAWKEQSALQSGRAAAQAMLTQTFPQIKVVVDAPLQMEREVAALRQATGASSGRDLETMLAAVGSALPADRAAGAIEFSAGEARIRGLRLSAEEGSALAIRLKLQGFTSRLEGDVLTVKQDTATEAAP